DRADRPGGEHHRAEDGLLGLEILGRNRCGWEVLGELGDLGHPGLVNCGRGAVATCGRPFRTLSEVGHVQAFGNTCSQTRRTELWKVVRLGAASSERNPTRSRAPGESRYAIGSTGASSPGSVTAGSSSAGGSAAGASGSTIASTGSSTGSGASGAAPASSAGAVGSGSGS